MGLWTYSVLNEEFCGSCLFILIPSRGRIFQNQNSETKQEMVLEKKKKDAFKMPPFTSFPIPAVYYKGQAYLEPEWEIQASEDGMKLSLCRLHMLILNIKYFKGHFNQFFVQEFGDLPHPFLTILYYLVLTEK